MRIAYSEALQSICGNPCPRQTVIPPNRLETSNWDLVAALAWVQDRDPLAALRDALRNLTGRQHIFFAPSGRCAIAQVLSLLPQREVVMPAFTCSVVKTAAEIAGKRIVYVDIAKNGVNATSAEYAEAAKPGRILLATHLLGIPTDIGAIYELARNRDCVVIEDAAAAFGARYKGGLLGTHADFGVFSFERSKRLPAFRGAAIVVNNQERFAPARLGTNPFVKTERMMPIRDLVFALVYNVATIPWLYGRLTLPRLLREYVHNDINANASTAPDISEQGNATRTVFYTREFHPYQAELVLRMLKRMDRIRQHTARLVSLYLDAFRNQQIATFLPPERDDAALLRFPISFYGKERADILRLALSRGLYLETNFEDLLPEKSEHGRFPNAVWAARNLVLLPLYTALSLRRAERLAQQVVGLATHAPIQSSA
jgi:dTDP-4-amino-4,6-dideoxygalactose transaminase